MTDFGKGPTLVESNPWLRDEAERIERILDATNRNSVIEGLPPLTTELLDELRRELSISSEPAQGPDK